MLQWFERHAPIRRKFRMLLAIHGALGLVSLIATILAAAGGNAYLAVIIAAASLIAMVITVAISSKLICTPYVTTVLRMEALAAGDTDSPIKFSDHRDCVGRMARAMTTFRANALEVGKLTEEQRVVVNEISSGLQKLAEKDLEFEIDQAFPENYDLLRTNFNAAVQALGDAMRTVRVGTTSVHRSIREISEATADLAERNETQASRLAQIAGSLTSVTTLVRETASGALSVQQSVTTANQEASAGGEVVRRAITAMAAIETSAQEIGQIIAVIDGIAFQTNLLALNAGVEAARAGEAGRGFAVVATEVRALAQRSAEAAQSIKTLITTSGQQVAAGVELVGQSGERLDRIVRGVSDINALIDGIASSASQQAENLTEVTAAMDEMERMTQHNAAMVEQSSAATRSLSSEANNLIDLVATFRSRELATRPAVVADPDRVRRSSAIDSAGGRRRTRGAAPDQTVHKIAPPASTSASATPISERKPAPARMAAPVASNLAFKPEASGDWSEF